MYREALPLFVLKGRKGGRVWMLVGAATTDPPRLFRSAAAFSKLRFGFASLAWSFPRYAISDGSFALGLAAGGGEKDGGG